MYKLNLNAEPKPDQDVAPSQAQKPSVDSVQSPVDETPMVGNNQTSPLVAKPQGKSMTKSSVKSKTIMVAVAIVLGVVTGFGGHKLRAGNGPATFEGEEIQRHPGESIAEGDVFGSADEKTFKDSAEGYLEIGGIDGEGSHRLSRPGGDSQTVYLTSSVVDLDDFEGMDVKVWGETYKGQTAGWLMDVGRVQVVSTQGTAPSEE